MHKTSQDKDIYMHNVLHSSKSSSSLCYERSSGTNMSQDLFCGSTITASSDEPTRILLNLSDEKLKIASDSLDDKYSDKDLIEIQDTSSNFKSTHHKRLTNYDSFDRNHKICQINQFTEKRILNYKDVSNELEEFNTALDIHDNSCKSEYEQTNIEQCLLDLDDYLEKMDGDCYQDAEYDLNKNNSIILMPKCISQSLRKKRSSKKDSQFQRSSKMRNTISCSSSKHKFEHEAAPIYATWNKKPFKFINRQFEMTTQNISNTFNTNLNKKKNMLQCSTNINESKSSENITALTINLQNENPSKLTLNGLQVLTDDQIFQNLIEQQEIHMQNGNGNGRSRQFGRRAERNLTNPNQGPISVPTSTGISEVCSHNTNLYVVSDVSTTRTSCNTSPVSTESSTDSGESLAISDNVEEPTITVNGNDNQQSAPHIIDSENIDESPNSDFNSYWPNSYSRTFALVSCTLGLFNISRFAVLTINYGGNFLIQFFVFSIIFGIPFLWLQMCLGAKIEAGPISMWKISPICIGIGISLIFVQYFITIYSSVVIAWLLVYARDIFIYRSSYPWSAIVHPIIPRNPSHIYTNLTESIPDYLNVNVLQRLEIFKINYGNGVHLHISDRVAFNLVILWAAVFLILCKGLKSFGKICLLLGILPIVVLAVIAVKLLVIVDFAKLKSVFSSSEFDEFLINSKTWVAAAQEAFLTWSFLGVSIIAISSRTHRNSTKLTLRSDAILVVLITFIGLSLSALIGLCSIQIINESGYVYVPGSYENPDHYSAIFSLKSSPNSDIISYPTRFVPHYSTLIGEVYRSRTDIKNVSGYQVLRFVTELLPAVVAIATENISWIWTFVIFITFLIFGISQLCVMWKPFSCALGTSSSGVLLSCITGLLLSVPFATELGITLLHYMDILLGGAWFIPVLWTAHIFGVFLIRGRPYNGDDLVNDLKISGSMSAFLALSWNVLLPIGLITLAVIEYKTSLSSQLYYWRGKSYFSYWSRKVGALTQVGFLLVVPISAIVQIYRYLTSGPPDILDRIQMLYRPLDETEDIRRISRNIVNSRYYNENNENYGTEHFRNDAPPKYTPPPSYTTATGARLAKILRQSLRRSVRRIIGEAERPRPRPILPIQHETENELTSYPSVLPRDFRTANEIRAATNEPAEIGNAPSSSLHYGRSLSLGRKLILNKRRFREASERNISQTINCVSYSNRRSPGSLNNRPYTAEDVITILRSSTLGRRRVSRTVRSQTEVVFRSIENLVQNAEPPNLSSPIINQHSNQNDQDSTSMM